VKTKFDAILKIEKNLLDEHIKKINVLKSRLNDLNERKKSILDHYQNTLKNTDIDEFSMMQMKYYGNYVMDSISKIDEDREAILKQIEEQQDVIAEQFNNVKKIELIIKQKKLEAKKIEDKKEQIFLDEIRTDALKI